jgi:proteasome-associated ATPase
VTSLRELEEALQEQQETLERLAEEPLNTATVVRIEKKDVLVATSKGPIVIVQPAGVKLKEGDSILVHSQSQQFLRPNPFPNEGFVTAVSDITDKEATIELNGRSVLVPSIEGLKAGDKVVMDEYGSFIVRILPRKKNDYAVPDTSVTWDDIGGCEAAKQAMIEAIEHPHKYRNLYEHYGAKGAKGILLYGPPGCGKTMLGKAAASSIGSSDGFIYCKGPEVLDPFVGVAEATIRGLFNRARAYRSEAGKRAVIFIDEAEALLGQRGAHYAHMEKTIVPTFLAEMDGVEESGAVVILATNRSMALDPAVVRDGRVDRKIGISRPNLEESKQITMAHLRKVPLSGDLGELSCYIAEQAWVAKFQHQGKKLPLSAYMSGALLAGIVEKAKANAIRRDIQNNTQTGVCPVDVDVGLQITVTEMGATSLETL